MRGTLLRDILELIIFGRTFLFLAATTAYAEQEYRTKEPKCRVHLPQDKKRIYDFHFLANSVFHQTCYSCSARGIAAFGCCGCCRPSIVHTDHGSTDSVPLQISGIPLNFPFDLPIGRQKGIEVSLGTRSKRVVDSSAVTQGG